MDVFEVTKNPDVYQAYQLDHDATRYFPDGHVEMAAKGDYVVTAPDGTETFVSQEQFQKAYTPVTSGGTTPGTTDATPSTPTPIAPLPPVSGFTGGTVNVPATH